MTSTASQVSRDTHLTIEKEKALLLKARQGCRRSIHKLIEAYSPLLKSICVELFSSRDREEYEQQAWIEAYELVAGYKGECGVGAYLKRFLPKRLLTYTNQNTYPIRLTKHAIAKFNAGLAPELEQMKQVATGETIDYQESSYEQPSDAVERWDFSEQVREVIDSLPEKERQVLLGIFVQNSTLTQLAENFGMTPQGISILKKRTLQRLQQHPGALELAKEVPEIAAFMEEAIAEEAIAETSQSTVKVKKKLAIFKSLLNEPIESVLYWMSTIVSNQTKPMQLTFQKRSPLQINKLRPNTYLKLAMIPFIVLSFTHNVAWSIPSLLIANYLELQYVRHSLKSISPKAKLVASVAAILGLSIYASPVFAQVQFSFLLGATEEMLKTCYLSTNATVTFVIGALAASFRGVVAWKLGNEAFQYVEDKRNDQSGTSHLKNLGYGLLAFVIVGAFEPYLARPCGAGGAGGVGAPTPPTPPTP